MAIVGFIVAFAVMKYLKSNSQYHPWSFVFIIEGVFTMLWGILAYYITPDIVERAKFLTETERTTWLENLKSDKSSAKHEINRKQIIEALLDFKIWLLSIIYLCYQAVITAIVFAAVPIIKEIGFDSYNSILLGIPSGILVFLIMIILSWSADKFNDRSMHIIVAALLSYIAFFSLIFFQPQNLKQTWVLYALSLFAVH